MSDTNKHAHQFDTNNSKVRKEKGNNNRRKNNKILYDESENYLNVRISNKKEVSDKKGTGR